MEEKKVRYGETHLEFDESQAFNPYCYNCSKYEIKKTRCDLKDSKQNPLDTCASFIERSNFSDKEINVRVKEDTKIKNKIKIKQVITPSGDSIMIDNFQENVEKFYLHQPFFYDKNNMFWLWNKEESKYEMVDDTDMMILLDQILGFKGQTISSRLKNNYLEAFERVGRVHIPKEPPKKWIQFKDKAFSLGSQNIYKVTPDYFFANPIPWAIGSSDETPTMDKLIKEWVGEEYIETAYQIIAYCCYANYPIHLIFCLVGCGRNGKSKFLGLIHKFIGEDNICSTELDTLLTSRFESFKLYKKLVCCMGETNFGVISKTSLLKKLTGQDLIGFEFKNKKPFDEYNYAKIMIASNSLPTTEDTSEGFYRRWMILDFPNIFPEGDDILKKIPDGEYSHLASKVTKILPKLLAQHKFDKQGSIQDRKNKYIMASNPLQFFIEKACNKDFNLYMRYSELYTAYRKYLHLSKKRAISHREFNNVLAIEGLEVEKTSKKINEEWVNGRFILGIDLKVNWEKELDVTDVTLVTTNPLSPIGILAKSDLQHKRHKRHESPQEAKVTEEKVEDWEKLESPYYIKCAVCGSNPSHYSYKGQFFCSEVCLKAKMAQRPLK